MKTVRMALLGLILGSVACGDGGKESVEPGHCVREDMCSELVDGNAADFASACKATGGSYAEGDCDTSEYDLKCTQVVTDTETGEEQTYANYYAEGEDLFCAGEEEEL